MLRISLLTYLHCIFAATLWPQMVTAEPTPPLQDQHVRDKKDNAFILKETAGLTGQIAFSAKQDGRWKIFLLNLSERTVTNLIDSPGNNYSPSFSPDGKQLVFISDRTGSPEVFLTSWKGSQSAQVTRLGLPIKYLFWNSETLGITYATYNNKEDTTTFWVLDTTLQKTEKIAQTRTKGAHPNLSPDGMKVVYSTAHSWPGLDICFFERGASQERCLLSGTKTFETPRFSHKGDAIALSYGDAYNKDIGIYSLDKGSFEKVTKLSRWETEPEWSPDDKDIIFVADTESAGVFSIWILDTTTKQARMLLTSQYTIHHLSWAPVPTTEQGAIN